MIMSRIKPERKTDKDIIRMDETIQNPSLFACWGSFDTFWAECVKGGSPSIKNACIAHLKSVGAWEDQSKWIEAVQHFGIPIEK